MPQWRGWNRYRVPGGEGKVGDDRNESVTLETQKQVQSPWGWGIRGQERGGLEGESLSIFLKV